MSIWEALFCTDPFKVGQDYLFKIAYNSFPISPMIWAVPDIVALREGKAWVAALGFALGRLKVPRK